MRSTTRLSAIAVTAAALAAAGAVASTGSAQDPAEPQVLELIAPERSTTSAVNDVAPRRRESPGDVFMVRSGLRDPAGAVAGSAHAFFVQTPGRAVLGNATFVLPSGRIMAVGALVGRGPTNDLAIVGGTGAYTGAEGTVAVTQGETTRFRLTITR